MKYSIGAISDQEWAEAEAYFKKNTKEIKFKKILTTGKKEHGRSFIRFGKKIYALDNQSKLGFYSEMDAGSGSFGRVKYGVDKNGNRVCVKITNASHALNGSIMKYLSTTGYFLGQEKRTTKGGKLKVARGEEHDVSEKVYTAVKFSGENSLDDLVYKRELNAQDKIVICLHAMMEISVLHKAGFLHTDIKPDNFMVDIQGDRLVVTPIDLDDAKELTLGLFKSLYNEMFKNKNNAFTPAYAAPEVIKALKYSIESDIYSLGGMLKNMGAPRPLYSKMLDSDPTKRISLAVAMEGVADYLKKIEGNSVPIKQALESYEIFVKQNIEQSKPVQKTELGIKEADLEKAAVVVFSGKEQLPEKISSKTTESSEAYKAKSPKSKN